MLYLLISLTTILEYGILTLEGVMEANETLAYIAGILDGEGTVRIAVHKNGSSTSLVRIYNTCKELIDYINVLLPGYVYTRGRMAKYPNYSDLHSIAWYGKNAVDILELLLPYLIVKRRQAELFIEFYHVCISSRGGTSRALSDAEVILRDSYKEEMVGLNRHGRRSVD